MLNRVVKLKLSPCLWGLVVKVSNYPDTNTSLLIEIENHQNVIEIRFLTIQSTKKIIQVCSKSGSWQNIEVGFEDIGIF